MSYDAVEYLLRKFLVQTVVSIIDAVEYLLRRFLVQTIVSAVIAAVEYYSRHS